MKTVDVLIMGAGAAGLMCAIEAGKRGRSVLVLDHARKAAGKIRISGGGRCNFTNLHASPNNFLSNNPRFCVSALKRYTPQDFLTLVERYSIGWHEKTLGQLFCDVSAQSIIDMLLDECQAANVLISLNTTIDEVNAAADGGFTVATSNGLFHSQSAVVATGGPSIPKMGASGFAYKLAQQFGLEVVSPRPALVPLTFDAALKEKTQHLAGITVDALVSHGKTRFQEGLVFTHRGVSGPSILQISSYWREGEEIQINLAPDLDCLAALKRLRTEQPKQDVRTALANLLPKRLGQFIADEYAFQGRLADHSDKLLQKIANAVNAWSLKPVGTEGYRTAEVTLGGVDTQELSSKTMEARNIPGLYFIGEAVDVTGHLGGYNFQWAWASGHAAGQTV